MGTRRKALRPGIIAVSMASAIGLIVAAATAYAMAETVADTLAETSYEAEAPANTRSGQVGTASCAGCSGDQKIRYIGNNSSNWLRFNGIQAVSSGPYQLTIAATVDGTRSFSVSVNGGPAQQVSVAGSSWSEPVTRNITVSLNAGSNTIQFSNSSAWAPDLDRITVGDGGTGPSPTPSPTSGGPGPVEPGGWIAFTPSFTEQERGCGQIDGLRFTLTCADDGDMRAELRYETYSSGTHQFQGYFRITSMGGTRISLKQTFRPEIGAYFMLAVERGGRLYSVSGGQAIATGATVGTTVRVNTVHVVGGQHRTYINGTLRHTTSSPGGEFHHKIGAYATGSGQGPITVEWSNVQFWYK